MIPDLKYKQMQLKYFDVLIFAHRCKYKHSTITQHSVKMQSSRYCDMIQRIAAEAFTAI
jgi:hypothetical protein